MRPERAKYSSADYLLEELPMKAPPKPPKVQPTNNTINNDNSQANTQRFPDWVSPDTWRLIDQRSSLKRQGTQSNEHNDQLRTLNTIIRKHIRRDRKLRTTKAGSEIEQLLHDKDIRGAWHRMKRWYRQVSGSRPKPSPLDMSEITTTYTDLYRNNTNINNQIPNINYISTPIDDSVPTEDEIRFAVLYLKQWKDSGPSGLRAKDLQAWERDKTNTTNWNNLVTTIQHIFRTGEVPQRLSYSNLVIIPKSDGGFRGIGLLEPIWKVISTIIKDRCNESITFDDSLHGFRSERGTSTAILEAKLQKGNQDFSRKDHVSSVFRPVKSLRHG
jgi:hypothetical protein